MAAQRESDDPDAATELQNVLRISLSGCHIQAADDIALLSCAKLRICNLQACYVRDISPFYGCIHLLKLELSDNQVHVGVVDCVTLALFPIAYKEKLGED